VRCCKSGYGLLVCMTAGRFFVTNGEFIKGLCEVESGDV